MATNPNRPEYQDTIESTWGQSVADHVIRRYATPAERDADLAALTPADLEGQVVNVNGDLMEYTHGAWAARPLVLAAGTTLTSDAFGNVSIFLPAAAKLVASTAAGALLANPSLIVVNGQDGPVGGGVAVFKICHPDGTAWPSAALSFHYHIAINY